MSNTAKEMDVLKGEEVASSSWEESSSSSSEEEESDSAAAAYYGQRHTVTPRHPSMSAMQLVRQMQEMAGKLHRMLMTLPPGSACRGGQPIRADVGPEAALASAPHDAPGVCVRQIALDWLAQTRMERGPLRIPYLTSGGLR